MIAPSGEQFEIVAGEQRAVIVEVGGGLRAYRAGERELLDGFPADGLSSSGRGQVLIPWPNRLEDGSYEFGGRRHQLPLTEPEHRNAIHGLVRWVSWKAAERESNRVVMEHVLYPQPGYPFTLQLRIEYALSDEGLSVRTTATNAGAERCPYGAGAHPYLTVGTETVDGVVLHVPAREVLRANERGIPVDSVALDGSPYDFRNPRPIGATKLDHAFSGLERGEDGFARVSLHDPAGGSDLTLWVDASYAYVMVFTGDPLPDVNRRSIAVEPMTCPPNAFRTGTDLIVLEPGASHTGAWGLSQ